MVCQFRKVALAMGVIYALPSIALEPAPVELGGFQMIPTLSITTGHDSNPFSASDSDVNEDGVVGPEEAADSMLVSTISPKLQFLAQNKDNVYSVDLGITRGIFHDSTGDNYTDWNIGANALLVLDSRNKLDLGVEYLEGHEDRGAGSTQGISGFIVGPTEYDDTTLDGKYTFGADSAKMRVELTADYLKKYFDRNGPVGDTIAARDREDTSFGARALYAVSADTDITAEIKNTDIDYNNDNLRSDTLDGSELEYFIGLEWQATGKTSGFAKAGYTDKEFESTARDADADGFFSWGVGVVWEPRTYSQVTVETSRGAEETPSIGQYIETAVYGVTWTHGWSEQLSSDLSYNLRQEDYVGSLQDDDTDAFSAGLTYAFDRWMDIGLAWEYTDKTSTVDSLDYDRNKIILSVDLSL